MADSISPEKRSWNMAQIHSKDTSIEIKVRKWLFSKGYRYRKNVNTLPGKPDVVLGKYKIVIFIHGCFWHRHENCKRATFPKSKESYWSQKFNKNVENDKNHYSLLESLGYKVIVVWECEINNAFESTMQRLDEQIKGIDSAK